jgi:hypothetical protein
MISPYLVHNRLAGTTPGISPWNELLALAACRFELPIDDVLQRITLQLHEVEDALGWVFDQPVALQQLLHIRGRGGRLPVRAAISSSAR